MHVAGNGNFSLTVHRGRFPIIAFRLGCQNATGVLTLRSAGTSTVFVLRHGAVVATGRGKQIHDIKRSLARWSNAECTQLVFDGGTSAYPPTAFASVFSLAAWARHHIEAQLDAHRARTFADRLAGIRLQLRGPAIPTAICDATDTRILASLQHARRLDELYTLARAPRYRLLAFLYFLQMVEHIELTGVAAPRHRDPLENARKLLGLSAHADTPSVKRAYRRLARTLHPDFHPEASDARKRELSAKLQQVNQAYQVLLAG